MYSLAYIYIKKKNDNVCVTLIKNQYCQNYWENMSESNNTILD